MVRENFHSFGINVLFNTYRYRKDGAENYQYIDVVPTGTNHFEVQDLKVGTKYSFSIKAYNSLGESSYTSDIGKVETKSKTFVSFIL